MADKIRPADSENQPARRCPGMLLLIVTAAVFAQACAASGPVASWSRLPDLPDPLGLAGHFAGIHNDMLIVAGGANFSEPVWSSTKSWHDEIYILPLNGLPENPNPWIEHLRLPSPRAYGASISTPKGIICIGGTDGRQTTADVFLLRWDAQAQTIRIDPLPPLPRPCAYTAAAAIGETIYVAGGTESLGLETAMRNFWRLDLSASGHDSPFAWEELLPWPGPSRAFNIVLSQHNGNYDCIYVLSGRRTDARAGMNGPVQFLTDMYEFTPALYDPGKYDAAQASCSGRSGPWRRCCDAPRCVMGGPGIAVGQSHLLVLGGADGTLFDKTDQLKDNHPGFPPDALAYNTITDTWFSAGPLPANQVTTVAIPRPGRSGESRIIVPSGEIRPRRRSPAIWQVSPAANANGFGSADCLMLLAYLTGVLAIGFYFSFRNRNTNDYFRGGQRVNWFVAGMSIFATMLSSITFMAIPAKAYATDWEFFLVNMMAVVVAPLVIFFFLPFFHRIDATSAYEYLERRFNRACRLFASASFLLFQVGRMAIVMYLPALALSTLVPLTDVQCILIMGVISLVYCTLGGLRAVVWTDTIQTFVLLGGAVLSLVLIMARIDGGLGRFVEIAAVQGKFKMVRWDWTSAGIATSALWVVVLGGLGQQLVPYSSDMAIVQRYMSVPDEQRARRAILANAIITIPASILFFSLGTALYVFYKTHPGELNPFHQTDAIFPLFIANELPAGLSGLVVAGIFAAAQSTVSTSMNSTSTAFMTDFVPLAAPRLNELARLRLARLTTAVFGVLGVFIALLLARSSITSLWDTFMSILGLLGGSMCGLFCLGVFTRRAHGTGAILGAVVAAFILYAVQHLTRVHFLLYAAIGIAGCFVVGYLFSLVLPARRPTDGAMTIYGLPRSPAKRK